MNAFLLALTTLALPLASASPKAPARTVARLGRVIQCGQSPCFSTTITIKQGRRVVRRVSLHTGPGLVQDVRRRFGSRASGVFTALMDALGPALRRRGERARGAASLALQRLDRAGVARYLSVRPGVEVAPRIKPRLVRIARRYFLEMGRRIVVTSGARDAARQAAAMYGKLRLGARLVNRYRNQRAARALSTVYRRGRKARFTRHRIISEMATLITRQIQRGVYISRHLRAGAVDIRVRDMSAAQRKAFRRAVRTEKRVRAILERRPPHFHLSFR